MSKRKCAEAQAGQLIESGHIWLGLLWLVINLFTSVIFPREIIKFDTFY